MTTDTDQDARRVPDPRAALRDLLARPEVPGVKSLGTYLQEIMSRPEDFRTVSRPVNPANFDCTALLEHLDRRKEYPAVLFQDALDVYGEPSSFPLLMNLWATRERCAGSVGVPVGKAYAELGSIFSELTAKPVEPELIASSDAPAQAHILRGEAADMWRLPAVRHSEMDLGTVLTMALAMKAPGGDFYNITFVKTFMENGHRGGLTIHSTDMSRMLRLWESRGKRDERIPVINILGHHPAFWLGTCNRTPYGDNEYATAGGFLGQAVRLAPSVTWGEDFLVPADAEIIIEGTITPGERTIVDPFGEISGQYQPQELDPPMDITAITYRDGAIMQDIFSGHREHMLLGSIPREGAIFDHLNHQFGNVTAVHAPYSGVGRRIAYIAIKKTGEFQPKLAAVAALSHVTTSLQVVVVVDDDVDVFNEEKVVWALATYVDPNRDIDLIRNLKPTTDPTGLDSSRVIIDATRPTHVPFPTRMKVSDEALGRVLPEEWLDAIGNG